MRMAKVIPFKCLLFGGAFLKCALWNADEIRFHRLHLYMFKWLGILFAVVVGWLFTLVDKNENENEKKKNRTVNNDGKFIRHSEKTSRIYNTDARASSSHVTVIFCVICRRSISTTHYIIFRYERNERQCVCAVHVVRYTAQRHNNKV